MNRKGQQSLTKTGILFSILIFYTILIALIGLSSSYVSSSEIEYYEIVDENFRCDCGVLSCSEYRLVHGQDALDELCTAQQESSNENNIFSIGSIISGLESLPVIVNFILFTPLVTIIIWIFVSSLPTFNGGG